MTNVQVADAFNVRADAAQRWIEVALERIEESPGGPSVLEQPSWADIYAAYKSVVPMELQWQPWRLAQELPPWVSAGRYLRKSGAARFPTVHYAGVRIKSRK